MAYIPCKIGARRVEDGTEFPFVDGNTDYEAYKLWLAAGNTPLPPDPVDLTTPVWDEFRGRRDLYLGRLSDIAGRYQRKGDPDIPPACDAIAEGLLAMPADPTLTAITTADPLRAAIVVAANQLVRAQLTDPVTGLPKPSAPSIKAALDKLFKQP